MGAPVAPGPPGGHGWHSMSFSPHTRLVYLPVQETGFLYKSDEHFQKKAIGYNVGIDFVAGGMPQQPEVKKAILGTIKGHLSAWDPIQQREVWRVDRQSPVNGGLLSTAGNLVFQGTAQGNLEAYRADTGQKLWSADAQSGVVASPMTYTVGAEQYIAVLAGWGGVFPLAAGEAALSSGRTQNISRLLAFKLNSKTSLPPLPQFTPPQLNPPKSIATAATIHRGEALFQPLCSPCHGDVAVGGGVLPDLRYSGSLDNDQWFEIVLLPPCHERRHFDARQPIVQPLLLSRRVRQEAPHRVAIVNRQLVRENLPQRVFSHPARIVENRFHHSAHRRQRTRIQVRNRRILLQPCRINQHQLLNAY